MLRKQKTARRVTARPYAPEIPGRQSRIPVVCRERMYRKPEASQTQRMHHDESKSNERGQAHLNAG